MARLARLAATIRRNSDLRLVAAQLAVAPKPA